MNRVVFGLLTMAAAPTAAAAPFTSQAGGWVDVHGGFAAGYRWSPGYSWDVGVGGWIGHHDPEFRRGRFVSLGLRAGQDVTFSAPFTFYRVLVLTEVDYGVDYKWVGLRIGADLGAAVLSCSMVDNPGKSCDVVSVDGTLAVHPALVARVHPFVGVVLRPWIGFDFPLDVSPTAGIGLGLEFRAPRRVRDVADAHLEEGQVVPVAIDRTHEREARLADRDELIARARTLSIQSSVPLGVVAGVLADSYQRLGRELPPDDELIGDWDAVQRLIETQHLSTGLIVDRILKGAGDAAPGTPVSQLLQ